MGECLITRLGGELFKLPVLDANYPENVSLTVIKGNTESASFRVAIAEAGTPAEYTYQWYCNGSAVEGATSPSYVKADLTEAGIHEFYCEVKNKAGTVTSRVAVLNVTMHDVPVLSSTYPADVTADVGSSAEFKVQIEMNGNPAEYTYQWYLNDAAVENATGATYTMSDLAPGVSNVYCKVTNAAGVVTSRTAKLSVTTRDLFSTDKGFSDITGGFEVLTFGSGSKSCNINENSIYVYAKGDPSYTAMAGACTKNKIDMTGVKKITAAGTCSEFRTGAWVGIRVHSNKELGDSKHVAQTYVDKTGSFSLDLDVSSLSGGSYYIILCALGYYNGYASGTFSKITMHY